MEENISQVDGLRIMLGNDYTIKKDVRVITILSGKGGVGKSTISTNLAILYGEIGKKVLIMDGDLGLANVNVLMGLVPRFTILDVLKGTKTISDIITPFNNRVDLLPGATGFYQLADISSEKQDIIINGFMALDSYDIIIIDAGAGISSSVISFTDIAHDVILVSTPEPTALTDAYGMIKVIASKSNKDKANLIVNMAPSEQRGFYVYQKLHSISHRFLSFNLEYLGSVQNSVELKNSILEQKPVVLASPNSLVTANLKTIIAKLEKIDEKTIGKKEYNGVGDFFKNLLAFKKQ